MADKRDLILDISIPYCIKPVKYIGGYQLNGSNAEKDRYMESLMQELSSFGGELDDYELKAVRIGGNASVMSPDLLGALMSEIRKVIPTDPHAEFSFSAVPCTVGTPSLTGISAGRPNRASLVIRSYLDEVFAQLNCPFNIGDVRNALLFFGKFHMNNLDLTINYPIPRQSRHDWEFTVTSCCNCRPAHISIEPLELPAEEMPSEEELVSGYEAACRILEREGYRQYAAGRFALAGHESRFEVLSRSGCELLSLGLGAVSCYDGMLTRNTGKASIYLTSAGDFSKITAQALECSEDYLMRRYCAGRLTLAEGLSEEEFYGRFSKQLPDDIKAVISALEAEGCAEEHGGRIVPTAKGMCLASKTAARFE